MDAHVEVADVDDLLGERAQADVDPQVVGVPEGDMLERVEVEVRVELAVERPRSTLRLNSAVTPARSL